MKEYILLLITVVLLLSISIYNYINYLRLNKAKNTYTDKKVFELNCHLSSIDVTIGEISNILTLILSLFLLIITYFIITSTKSKVITNKV